MNLDFKNAVFEAGMNVTCRRGLKWYEANFRLGQNIPITENSEPTDWVAHIEDVTVCSIKAIDECFLQWEHDPACRTKEGLIAVMRATYGEDFSPDEECTWIAFTVVSVNG